MIMTWHEGSAHSLVKLSSTLRGSAYLARRRGRVGSELGYGPGSGTGTVRGRARARRGGLGFGEEGSG